MRSYGAKCTIHTIDNDDGQVNDLVRKDPDIKFRVADVFKIEEAFPKELLQV